MALTLLTLKGNPWHPVVKRSVVKEYYELLRLVVDHGAYPVVIVDEDSVVQMTNPAADRLFASTADDMVGRLLPYPVNGVHLAGGLMVQAEDESWSAEMQVEPAQLNGRKMFVVSLRDTNKGSSPDGVLFKARLIDPVTGLLNAEGFSVLAEHQLRCTRRSGKGMVLMLFDVDQLEFINRTQGRDAGDVALKQTAMLVKGTFRASDIVARLTEDTFAVAAPDAGEDTGSIMLARLRERMWDFNAHTTHGYHLHLHSGLAWHDPQTTDTIDILLARAASMLDGKREERGSSWSSERAAKVG